MPLRVDCVFKRQRVCWFVVCMNLLLYSQPANPASSE